LGDVIQISRISIENDTVAMENPHDFQQVLWRIGQKCPASEEAIDIRF
jgi:hypothetical protein